MAVGYAIPGVLIAPGKLSSISTLRALKQIRELLEKLEGENDHEEDRINASLDDLDVMIMCVDRPTPE